MRISWSLLSIERIQEIADYIARDNISAANDWIDATFKKVGQLKTAPEIGRVVPELKRNDMRELIHGNYRIIYSYSKSSIAILTVRHFKQLLPREEIRF
jgi:plasmid stabilization system protein ParE